MTYYNIFNDNPEAIKYIDKRRELGFQLKDTSYLVMVHRDYEYYYTHFNKKEAASRHHDSMVWFQSEISNTNLLKDYSQHIIEYETNVIEKALLKQKNRIYLYIIIGVILFAFALAYFIYNNLKLKRFNELQKKKIELDQKNRELVCLAATQTKNQAVLGNSLKEIDKIRQYNEDDKLDPLISNIRSDVRDLIGHENHWNDFKLHFEQVHPQFFDRLLKINKNLTPNDLKLSAYVKMGLSNKEIATILGINHRSVVQAKSRLKKKLANEKSDFNLFLITL